MTSKEIKSKILFNNQQIQKLLDPSIFVLQPKVQQLLEENEYLKSICTHEYNDGICVICGKAE